MRFTILTALLLPILASALAVPAATTTGLDNANGAALKVRQDGILGDETKGDSSVCGPGINEEDCAALGSNSVMCDAGTGIVKPCSDYGK